MPEEFAVAWNSGSARYRWWVWMSLPATAILGTTTYGMTMGLLGGPGDVLYKGFACTLAAGLAWGIPLPALYILNSLSGSRLPASSTLLAAIVTTSWRFGNDCVHSDQLFFLGRSTEFHIRVTRQSRGVRWRRRLWK